LVIIGVAAAVTVASIHPSVKSLFRAVNCQGFLNGSSNGVGRALGDGGSVVWVASNKMRCAIPPPYGTLAFECQSASPADKARGTPRLRRRVRIPDPPSKGGTSRGRLAEYLGFAPPRPRAPWRIRRDARATARRRVRLPFRFRRRAGEPCHMPRGRYR
jgi:hypothetical protein